MGIPEFTPRELITLACLELETEQAICLATKQPFEIISINGYDLVQILRHYLITHPAEEI